MDFLFFFFAINSTTTSNNISWSAWKKNKKGKKNKCWSSKLSSWLLQPVPGYRVQTKRLVICFSLRELRKITPPWEALVGQDTAISTWGSVLPATLEVWGFKEKRKPAVPHPGSAHPLTNLDCEMIIQSSFCCGAPTQCHDHLPNEVKWSN